MTIDERGLLAELAALAATGKNGLLAFDGDGTLWSGDVGEDVFHEAVTRGLLRDEARAALIEEARANGVETHGSSSELAARQGKSVTETVRAALIEAKEKLEQGRAQRDAQARAVLKKLRAMRGRPVREDVLYDEQGQPRL